MLVHAFDTLENTSPYVEEFAERLLRSSWRLLPDVARVVVLKQGQVCEKNPALLSFLGVDGL